MEGERVVARELEVAQYENMRMGRTGPIQERRGSAAGGWSIAAWYRRRRRGRASPERKPRRAGSRRQWRRRAPAGFWHRSGCGRGLSGMRAIMLLSSCILRLWMWYSRMATRCASAMLSSRRCEMMTEKRKNMSRKTRRRIRKRVSGVSGIPVRSGDASEHGRGAREHQHRDRGQQPAYRILHADVRAAHRDQHHDDQQDTLRTVVTFNRRSI